MGGVRVGPLALTRAPGEAFGGLKNINFETMRGVQVGPLALTRAPGEAFGAQHEIQCFRAPAADHKRQQTWPRLGFTETAAGAETNGNCEDVVKHGVLVAM